ncbi:15814_t:CDS:2, partial [Dentiscutata heterogama]
MATSNLCKHLDTHYPSSDSDKQTGQQSLTFIPKITISKQILISAQKTKLNSLIAEWIVSDTLLFSIVSGKSFATLLRYLNNSIDLSSCETMKSTIQNAFIVMQKDVQTLLQKHNLVKAINSSSSITQDFRELGKSVGESESISFVAAILDPRFKLELILADINTEVNHATFNNIFRSEYFALTLNNSSSTNLETLSNLSYTEQ